MKKIFVTAIGGDVGSGVLRCLRNENSNCFLVGCDIKKYNQGLEFVNKFILAEPYSDYDRYVEFIADVCKSENIDYFIPITEPEIRIVCDNLEKIESCGTKVLINNKLVIDTCLSKYKTAVFLRNHGIKVPVTIKAEEYNNELSFPVILKKDCDCGSKSIIKIQNEDELKKAIIHEPQSIIQEYIGNSDDEYTMCIFSDGNLVRSICFKRQLGYDGMSIYVELVHDSILTDVAEQIAKAFILKGSINVQMRKRNNEYYVFEINPRISSTVGFRYKSGFKDVVWWIQLVGENEVVEEYIPIEKKMIGIKKVDDLIFFE